MRVAVVFNQTSMVHDAALPWGGAMSRREREQTGEPASRRHAGARASRLAHRLLVTGALRLDPRHRSIRATTLAVIVAAGFALIGTARQFSAAEFFAHAPVKFDLALRAVAHGWYTPDGAILVTIVDIDSETHRAWGRPAVTPREPLARMLEVVTAAHPSAVVVDIDLSWGVDADAARDPGFVRLQHFLEHYAGPAPLIFPKRLERVPDGSLEIAASPFDELFLRNDSLAWAHAAFQTASGGAVRSWQDWVLVCDGGRPEWLPSVATSLALLLSTLPPGMERPVRPAVPTGDCEAPHAETRHERRLLIGPRITGDGQPAAGTNARAISASLLLDPQMARNDEQLFANRVVLIGATHSGAGDDWITLSGVLPGVELLADTVRYAPLESKMAGKAGDIVHRAVTLLLFGMLVVLERRFRGMIALLLGTAFMLAVVAVGLAGFEDLAVLDSVGAAILLFVIYKALETVLDFAADFRALRGRFPKGVKGMVRAVGAACLREP